ncbi:MAG: flagellar hook assembly protein FlgD [Hyphomicrobium sp.]|nr:flagellar hook assembly protein FlgD [Hyphomicrobium sp.]
MNSLAVTAASAGGTASDTKANASISGATLDYDAFLQLLLAQMNNQDPLNPIDSTEYVSQLATFSNVEQALKQNAKLDQLLVISNISQANAIVGHSITSADGAVTGQVVSVKIDSAGATATLRDGRTVEIGAGVSIGS